jgi:hypothetical protein
MKTVYRLVIDNGASYCGARAGDYATEADATEAGEAWLAQFYIDNDVTDIENDEAGFDVVEVEIADPENEDDESELLYKAALNRGQP